MNIETVKHDSWRLTPASPSCNIYTPHDEGRAQEFVDTYGAVIIVPGLGSVKADYEALGVVLAENGFTAISPNCNVAIEGSTAESALERRAEIITALLRERVERARLVPHSIGAPVTMYALRGALGRLDVSQVNSIDFMQPAGFGDHGPSDLYRATRFYRREVVPRTMKLLPAFVRRPKDVYERFDLRQRGRELRELWDLEDEFMQRAVLELDDLGVPMHFLVGPRDELTSAQDIRRAVAPIVGEERVQDIHPNAGHLPAQTHPNHVARLLIESFMRQTGTKSAGEQAA